MKVVVTTLEKCKEVLLDRAAGYSREGDRLSQFKEIAQLLNTDARVVLIHMWMKHVHAIVSSIVDKQTYSFEWMEEKITDSINYMLLLKALIEDIEEIADSYGM